MSRKSNVVPIKKAGEQTLDEKLRAAYQPVGEIELQALRKQHARRKRSNPASRLKITKQDGRGSVAIDHADGATGFTVLMESLGTSNIDFANGLLGQVCNVADANRSGSEDQANFALAMVTGFEPRDQVEAMLASQMAAIQMAMMTYARRTALAEHLTALESHEKAMNRLARTFTAQVEALKRYRSKGEQRVYVERVNVEPGGQAVVGNVQHGGSEKSGG